MKIAEYKQMMEYLTRPGFNGGGSVRNKTILPKKKPEEEVKKRKIKNFEKAKPALENPKEVKEMMDLADGGRIGFSKGGSAALAKILNELPDGTEVTRDMVQKIIDDNNLDITVRNFFAKPSKTLKEGITLVKQKSPIKITPEILKEFHDYVTKTNLDIKSIGEKFGFKTERGKDGKSIYGLDTNSKLYKEYVKAYGEPEPGRFKKFRLTVDDPIVQQRLDKVRELKSIKAAAKDLKIDRRQLAREVAKFDPELLKEIGAGEANIAGPETGPKKVKKRAVEIVKEGEKKAGAKTTKQAKEVIQGIADRNKVYANMSAEELAKDKNFLKRLRIRMNPSSGAVDFTGYTEANPVRGKVFNDVELAQHAINKAKNGELFTHDHITPKRFRKQNIQYPINFQPVTYMENSQFENARTYLTNNPSGNVAPINSYLKSNNKTIRFGKNKYGYTGNIVYNSKTGNQTLLDFEKRINVGGRGPVVSTFGAGQKLPSFGKAGKLAKILAKGEGILAPLFFAGGSMYGLPYKRALYEALYGDITGIGQSKSEALKEFQPQASKFLDFNDAQQKYDTLLNNYNNASPYDKLRFKDKMAEKTKEFENLQTQYQGLPLPERIQSEAAAGKAETQYEDLIKSNRERRYQYGVIPKKELFMDIKDYFGDIGKNIREKIQPTENVLGTTVPMGTVTGQTQYDFAGGGIAKLAGKSSGPAPESGPTPQGLDFLMKRGR